MGKTWPKRKTHREASSEGCRSLNSPCPARQEEPLSSTTPKAYLHTEGSFTSELVCSPHQESTSHTSHHTNEQDTRGNQNTSKATSIWIARLQQRRRNFCLLCPICSKGTDTPIRISDNSGERASRPSQVMDEKDSPSDALRERPYTHTRASERRARSSTTLPSERAEFDHERLGNRAIIDHPRGTCRRT